MKANQRLVVVVMVVIVVVGGISVFIFNGGNGKEEVLTAKTIEISSNEVIETEEPEAGLIPTKEDTQEPTEVIVEEGLLPTPRSGLESTDPSVVNLASGEIQLVEFFAFW